MSELTTKYGLILDKDEIARNLDFCAGNVENVVSEQVLKTCFSAMDVTTLSTNDTESKVKGLVEKVNGLSTQYPDLPRVASVCVYPNFAHVVRLARSTDELHVTCVSSCFPSAQSFLEVKVRECELAVEDGADEIDIVLALNSFLAGDYAAAGNEIKVMKEAIDRAAAKLGRRVILKVILETGLLVTPELIADASFLAMENGADFIKTSTGKVSVNATPTAAYVMCACIKAFYEKTGRKVGFKAAGGISTTLDAVSYYSIVSSVLGGEWLDNRYFRLGVSRLANALLSSLEQKTVVYF